MSRKHEIVLSNGQTLLLEEEENELHFAWLEKAPNDLEGTPWYFARAGEDGLLVVTDCNGAPCELSQGLKP